MSEAHDTRTLPSTQMMATTTETAAATAHVSPLKSLRQTDESAESVAALTRPGAKQSWTLTI